MKITSYEYHSLMWFVMRASFIGISLNNIINISKQNSWLAGLLTLLLGLIPLGIFIYLQNYEKDKNISEKVLDLFTRTFTTILQRMIRQGVISRLAYS